MAGEFLVAELIVPSQSTPVRSVVGLSHVAQVRAAATVFADWDNRVGSGSSAMRSTPRCATAPSCCGAGQAAHRPGPRASHAGPGAGGRDQGVLADERFSRARLADTPTWMARYDDAVHAGEAGHALGEAAVMAFSSPKHATTVVAA
ncbi:MAG: hypothetical protein ACRDSL_00830 [Pseudonocardiaceae bacterium]